MKTYRFSVVFALVAAPLSGCSGCNGDSTATTTDRGGSGGTGGSSGMAGMPAAGTGGGPSGGTGGMAGMPSVGVGGAPMGGMGGLGAAGKPPCAKNADCSVGEVCLMGMCGPCTKSSQCDGSLVCVKGKCITNVFSDRIFAATSNGGLIAPVFEITGGVTVQFALVNSDSWIGPIAATADGRFWASVNAMGGSLYEITAGGDFSAATPFATNIFGGVGYVNGLAFDAKGNAYLANSEKGPQQLARVAPDGTVTKLATMFDNPESILIEDDDMFISEGGTGKVYKHSLATGAETVFASGFVGGQDHISAQLAIDPDKHLFVLWTTPATAAPGLFDIHAGGDFSAAAALIAVPFSIDVNQLAISAAGDVYAAGASSGNAFVSHRVGGVQQPFEVFATNLGDTESIAIFHK